MAILQTTEVNISAVILAAGQSVRMGQPKMLLPFGDCIMLERVIRTAFDCGLDPIILVLGSQMEQIVEQLSLEWLHRVTLCHNEQSEQGLGSSLRAGLAMVNQEQACLVMLGDQPLVEGELVQRLVQAHRSSDALAVRPSFRDRPCHPVLLSKTMVRRAASLQGDQGFRQLLQNHSQVLQIEVEAEWQVLDADTPEDYARLLTEDGHRSSDDAGR